MKLAINEVKTQAKKLLKSLKTNPVTWQNMEPSLKRLSLPSKEELKLKHCLTLIAWQLGFDNWHHANTILSGQESITNQPNMGTFFYNNVCGGHINEWFADYQQANQTLLNQPNTKWLLPYKQQFIVVEKGFLTALNVDDSLLVLTTEIESDFYHGYNCDTWDKLASIIIRKRQRNF